MGDTMVSDCWLSGKKMEAVLFFSFQFCDVAKVVVILIHELFKPNLVNNKNMKGKSSNILMYFLDIFLNHV